MKVTLEQISGGIEEIIIKYKEMTEQIVGIVNYINQNEKKLIAMLVCTLIYIAVSYVLNWYDRKTGVTILFVFYMIFCYVCAFLLYKIKRDIDTKMLNKDLEDFKKNRDCGGFCRTGDDVSYTRTDRSGNTRE